MTLDKLRTDTAIKQKKGIHFILASILIWTAVLIVQLLDFPVLTKNLFVFCCTTPLVPLAYAISKVIGVKFSDSSNKLNELGVLFSINQVLYMIIAMWIYAAVPEKLVMVIAMIFGAHLLPYGWLYKSKSYNIMSVIIPILSLYIGCNHSAVVLAATMICIEIIFSICLYFENKKLQCIS